MNEMLLDFFENSVNSKKLKKSRLKRKLSLSEVSEKTGIPFTTLKRYEDGDTKKIPLDAVKKICEVYGTNYNTYYAWTTFPFFGSLGGVLISLFYGISIASIHNGATIGGFLGLTSMIGIEKLYAKLSDEKKNYKKIIYNSLEQNEKKEYQDFKIIATTVLKTNEILDDVEKEEVDSILLALYVLHKIRKVSKRKNIHLEDAEILNTETEEK